jgi:hypothetical protein
MVCYYLSRKIQEYVQINDEILSSGFVRRHLWTLKKFRFDHNRPNFAHIGAEYCWDDAEKYFPKYAYVPEGPEMDQVVEDCYTRMGVLVLWMWRTSIEINILSLCVTYVIGAIIVLQ